MRRTLTFAAAVALILAARGIAPGAGRAQGVRQDSFAIQRFVPAPGGANYLMVDGAAVGNHMASTVGLLVDYAHRPFVLRTASCAGGNTDDCRLEETKVDIVSYQLTFDAMASLALFSRLQLGLVLPVIASAGDSYNTPTPELADDYLDIRGGDAFGMGDPRLSAKLRLTSASSSVGVSLIGFATAPLGELTAKGHRLGDAGLGAGGHVALEFGVPRLRAAINLGARYRPHAVLLSTEVGSELTWGVAIGWSVTSSLRLLAETTGASRLSLQLDENPIEARVAAELGAGDFSFVLGGGSGLISGVGVPDLRVLAGISYRPQGLDSDGDGVNDKLDACPNELEDHDGYQDADGCPDPDNDADGIPDVRDRCPDRPEDRDGHQDEDGCPDDDDDGDGVLDGYDSCPNQPEDMDGDRDDDGCPDDDRDRDGVPDATDKCPEVAEDIDGFGDDDGCPETDFDNDQIPDEEDQCPDQPEDHDGYQDEDGCPEANPPAPTPASPHRTKARRKAKR